MSKVDMFFGTLVGLCFLGLVVFVSVSFPSQTMIVVGFVGIIWFLYIVGCVLRDND